jgi:hypothetical protein
MNANHRKDAEVRNDRCLIGREAYEASVAAVPLYDDGTRRKQWAELDVFTQWTWTRFFDYRPEVR